MTISTTEQLEQLETEIKTGLKVIIFALGIFQDGSNRGLYTGEEDIPIDDYFMISSFFGSLFEYAIQGYARDGSLEGHDMWDIEAFIDIAGPAMEAYDASRPYLCEQVYCAALARHKIDCYMGIAIHPINGSGSKLIPGFKEEVLTIKEVSLLANMNEKSVRNATHSTKSERLQTIKIGTRIYVKPDDALLWLNKRRGFVPTTVHKRQAYCK